MILFVIYLIVLAKIFKNSTLSRNDTIGSCFYFSNISNLTLGICACCYIQYFSICKITFLSFYC